MEQNSSQVENENLFFFLSSSPQPKFHEVECLTISDFQFFITAHSHGKNSSVLSLERPTYTDTKTYSLINTIDEPTEIRIVWNTLSGTGSQHKVLLKADRILPTRKTDLFSLNREWIFPYVVEGDQYTIDIEAISQGSDPIVREYHYTLIAFPSTPIPIDNQLSSTKNSISMGFESRGVRHKWYIKLVVFLFTICFIFTVLHFSKTLGLSFQQEIYPRQQNKTRNI